jgi:hypothetical protein
VERNLVSSDVADLGDRDDAALAISKGAYGCASATDVDLAVLVHTLAYLRVCSSVAAGRGGGTPDVFFASHECAGIDQHARTRRTPHQRHQQVADPCRIGACWYRG